MISCTRRIVVVRSEGGQGTAVLCSGGLDSAVLLADVARREADARRDGVASAGKVIPLYVSVGLAWEQRSLRCSARLLATSPFRDVGRSSPLRFDMRDVYPPTHWAIRGEAPAFDTPDEDVYLEGRNIVLLTKAAVFMARAKLTRVSIGPLAGNPFPDATPEFFDDDGACAVARSRTRRSRSRRHSRSCRRRTSSSWDGRSACRWS